MATTGSPVVWVLQEEALRVPVVFAYHLQTGWEDSDRLWAHYATPHAHRWAHNPRKHATRPHAIAACPAHR